MSQRSVPFTAPSSGRSITDNLGGNAESFRPILLGLKDLILLEDNFSVVTCNNIFSML